MRHLRDDQHTLFYPNWEGGEYIKVHSGYQGLFLISMFGMFFLALMVTYLKIKKPPLS